MINMVYLIGGAPRLGKSLFAQKLATATGSDLISTDDVCSRVTSALSEEERSRRFPLPSFSGTPVRNTLPVEERVNLQLVSAHSLESELDQIIDHAIQERKRLVLEGIHIMPSHAKQLLEKYGAQNIVAVFVGSDDLELVVDGIYKNTNPNNWLKESDSEVIRQVAEFVVAFSARIKQDAQHESLIYFERTPDFDSDRERFMQSIKLLCN